MEQARRSRASRATISGSLVGTAGAPSLVPGSPGPSNLEIPARRTADARRRRPRRRRLGRRVPLLTEVCVVTRTDRVYAVAVDTSGKRLAIGGRDKCVAMYDTPAPRTAAAAAAAGVDVDAPRPDAVKLWEHQSKDFVYRSISRTISASARTEAPRRWWWSRGADWARAATDSGDGTVWSVSTLVERTTCAWHSAASARPSSCIRWTNGKKCWNSVEEVVYDVGVTADALAYANGRRASMYGKGGTQSRGRTSRRSPCSRRSS